MSFYVIKVTDGEFMRAKPFHTQDEALANAKELATKNPTDMYAVLATVSTVQMPSAEVKVVHVIK